MAWLSLTTEDKRLFDASGLDGSAQADRFGHLNRGSIVIETRLSPQKKPQHLLQFERTGPNPIRLSLQAIPGGSLIFVLDQDGDVLHRVIDLTDAGRTDMVRLTYSWYVAASAGRLTVERTDKEVPVISTTTSPKALSLDDLFLLANQSGDCFLSPDVAYVAVSDRIEPIGPMPSLVLSTPIATPDGYRHAGDLKRGDVVLTADDEIVPVLYQIRRTVPACGSFSPIHLRVPFFGLKQPVQTAPTQRLVISGSEVEYMFGHEAVLVSAAHLAAGRAAFATRPKADFITYCQVLLPGHQTIDLAGAAAESLFIGRLRRKSDLLKASLLGHVDRNTLPEHAGSVHPVLHAFDAIALAEERVA